MTDSFSPNGKPAPAVPASLPEQPTPSPMGANGRLIADPAGNVKLPFGVSQAQYDAALADAGSRGIVPKATMNAATAAEAEAVQAFPAAQDPAHYDLTSYPIDTSDGDQASANEFDNLRRSWLVAAEVPRELGRSLVAAVTDAERRTANLTPEQKEIKSREASATLARLWGDKTQENIALADKLVRHVEAKAPGIMGYLAESGAANDPNVIAQLWMQAERFLATGGKL